MLHNFEERVLSLSVDDNVHIWRSQGLIGQQRGVPAAQNYRLFRKQFFRRFSNLSRFANHRARDERDSQAESVPQFLNHPVLKPGCDC